MPTFNKSNNRTAQGDGRQARLRHAANAGRHSFAERGPDLYQTPDVAVLALLRIEELPATVWECACGPGAIVRVLRDAGRHVIATDLVDYGCPESEWGVDFLLERALPDRSVGAILTNPPYKLAAEFVAHALTLCPRVIMLLRLAFLESRRRSALLDSGALARVHVFKDRLPMMHRNGWQGPRASSSIAFAWFVFDRSHSGPAILQRLSWRLP